MQATRILTLIGAFALIVFGIFQPIELESRWLLCLWGAAPLLGLFAWLSKPPKAKGRSRSVYNLALVIGVGFSLLSLQLLRHQVVTASEVYNYLHIDPETSQTTTNIRPILNSQRVLRGKIFDRNGIPLVNSQPVEGGYALRTYPLIHHFTPMAFSNIVGFFNTRFGASGLEATYGDYLSGERGSSFLKLQNELLGKPQVGNDLHLTLNGHLQARAYNLLGSLGYGSVVVLNPKTGAVLAMASVPGFDPRGLSFNYTTDDWSGEHTRIDQYWQQINGAGAGQPLINRPTQGLYAPGSTFKTITAIAALEHPDVAQPDDIRCFNELETESGAPPVVNAVPNLSSLTGDPSNLERVYAYSCNVAFAQYALRLGKERFTKQAERFDIFAPQHVPKSYDGFEEIPTFASRLYVEPGFLDRKAALADTGYGQGQLSVTPLQMAMVAASVASGGEMMRPYLVQEITRPDGGLVYTQVPRSIRRTMSADTAAKMRDNMRAVGQYGFGSVVNIVPGVMVGGKSGTAEHVPGQPPHAWFLAIAPVEDPRYAVAVMVESGGEGSSVGATLAGQVLREAFALETTASSP
jgi:peptidoglycan glycosyltransferase